MTSITRKDEFLERVGRMHGHRVAQICGELLAATNENFSDLGVLGTALLRANADAFSESIRLNGQPFNSVALGSAETDE